VKWEKLIVFSVSNIVFSGNVWVALKRAGFFGSKMRIQTWRWKELLQILEVTTIGSHAGSQAFGEVYHRLVDLFLWQLLPDGCKATFNSTVLGFDWRR